MREERSWRSTDFWESSGSFFHCQPPSLPILLPEPGSERKVLAKESWFSLLREWKPWKLEWQSFHSRPGCRRKINGGPTSSSQQRADSHLSRGPFENSLVDLSAFPREGGQIHNRSGAQLGTTSLNWFAGNLWISPLMGRLLRKPC